MPPFQLRGRRAALLTAITLASSYASASQFPRRPPPSCYHVREIPTSARAISQAGAVVGATAIGGNLRGFVYQDGQLRALNPLPVDQSTGANAINAQGDVAGISFIDGVQAHPVLYRAGDPNPEYLGTLGGIEGLAYGINDQQTVVGYSKINSRNYHAFVWRRQTGISDLGTLPGPDMDSQAYAINGQGEIVGVSFSHQSFTTPVRWDAKGNLQALPGLPAGHSAGLAQSINDLGQIAGEVSGDETEHLALWFPDQGYRLIDAGFLPEYPILRVGSLNNLGHIVGYAVRFDIGPPAILYTVAWFYDVSTSQIFDLNSLLAPDSSRWTVLQAYSINDSEQIVAIGRLTGSVPLRSLRKVTGSGLARRAGEPLQREALEGPLLLGSLPFTGRMEIDPPAHQSVNRENKQPAKLALPVFVWISLFSREEGLDTHPRSLRSVARLV